MMILYSKRETSVLYYLPLIVLNSLSLNQSAAAPVSNIPIHNSKQRGNESKVIRKDVWGKTRPCKLASDHYSDHFLAATMYETLIMTGYMVKYNT